MTFGGRQGPEIEPKGAVGRHVLHQGAAAVDEKFGLLEAVNGFPKVEGVEGVHPIGSAGVNGVAGEHLAGEIRVDGTQFPKDGQQDGIVSGVAPAVGAADDHLIPSVFLVAEDGFVDLHLPLNGGFDGELPFGLLVELMAHGFPKGRVPGQGEQMIGQRTVIPRWEQETIGPVVDEVGDAANLTADGGQPGPRPLRENIGEGF